MLIVNDRGYIQDMKPYLRSLLDEKRNRRRCHKKSTPEEANALATFEYTKMLKRPTLRCIRCEKKLFAVCDSEEDVSYQPYRGVMCTSSGNYGSTVFDSLSGKESMHFVVCDACLVLQAKHVSVFQDSKEDVLSLKEYLQAESEGGLE